MNVVTGMTSIARNADTPERKTYCLDKIDEAAQHLLGLINDILDMSKIEADEFELSFNEFNFVKMVRRALTPFDFRVAERAQTLSVELDDTIPDIIVSDEKRLAQVIMSLVSNAVKFTPERGAISLSAKKINENDVDCVIRFEVKDTGIGIPKEQQEIIFASFEQLDGGTARRFGGAGLGLTISKRIVDMMGGRIWLESEPGQGASFLFEIQVQIGAQGTSGSLPVESDEKTSQRRQEVKELPTNSDVFEARLFAERRILVAEDVEINREILAALLEDSGIQMTFACNGAEAVEKFRTAPDDYEIILMDIHMPDIDGYEATKLIRSSGLLRAASIPIIAMTANVFPEDIERCLAAGMNGHLGKPVDVDMLVAELKKYLL
jgi:CheY-like chemotaxis protein